MRCHYKENLSANKIKANKVLQYLDDTTKRKDILALADICGVSVDEIAEYIRVSPEEVRANITANGNERKQRDIVYTIFTLSRLFVFNYSMLTPNNLNYAALILTELWAGGYYLKKDKSGNYIAYDFKDNSEIITFT